MPKRRTSPPPERGGPHAGAGRPAPPSRRRRRKRYNYILYYILLLLLALAVGIALSLTVFFQLETVQVTGSSIYTEYQISSQAGLQLGENLFRFDTGEVAQRVLERFPFIEKVTVVRRLPSTVIIEVQPATPVGAIPQGDFYLLFSEAGKVLQVDSEVLPGGCYVVEGIHSEGLLPGDNLQKSAEESSSDPGGAESTAEGSPQKGAAEELRMLRYLLDSVEAVGFEGITRIDLSDIYNMKLVYQDRITVELGSEADMDYKLQFVRHVLLHNLEPDAAGTMSISVASKRITFHPDTTQEEGGLQAPPVDFNDGTAPPEEEDSPPEGEPSEGEAAPDVLEDGTIPPPGAESS